MQRACLLSPLLGVLGCRLMTSWQKMLLCIAAGQFWRPAAFLSLLPIKACNGLVKQEWTHYQPSSLAKEIAEGKMSTFREKPRGSQNRSSGLPSGGACSSLLTLLED